MLLRPSIPLVVLLGLAASLPTASAADANWRDYLGGSDRRHYSDLAQITPQNVGQLRVAWEYHTGDPGEMQCNPLVIDGVLYGMTAANNVVALDAATGAERWRYRPPGEKALRNVRGLAYWCDGNDCRLLFSVDEWLCAIDAKTGHPIDTFGDHGRTSLKAALGERAGKKYVISTTPGTVCQNLIVMPLRVTEEANAAPGFIQAFDIRTGKLAWVFHTIPRPGEPGAETWSEHAHENINVGGANNWAGMAVDAQRGLLFVPTGSASPDFWGGARVGQNLFANCLLALDARTGKLRWYYQFVHHDLWDRDPPSPPVLLTVRHNGKPIDVVAQVLKDGHVFVFNRDTGESLFPVEERPAPKSTMPGEVTWPTQPLPLQPAPFARQTLTANDLSPYAENRDEIAAMFKQAHVGRFEPFGKFDTLIFPGFDGGAEWGGPAVDRDGVLYVNVNEMAWICRLQDKPTQDNLAQLSPGHRVYAQWCFGCHGLDRKGNPASGYPSLVDIKNRKPRDQIMTLIATGKGMMPGFPWMATEQKQMLVDFLFDTERVEGAETRSQPPPSATDPAAYAPYEIVGYVKFLDRNGYPAISPPWGSLTAIDLNTGEQRWRITLGEFKELSAKGIPPTGTENYGGPIVTAGGVLFIAATKDGMFRAFDPHTGKQLWQTELPAPGFATPATYAVNGKQYIVVAAGGTKLGTKTGDSYIAYALP